MESQTVFKPKLKPKLFLLNCHLGGAACWQVSVQDADDAVPGPAADQGTVPRLHTAGTHDVV